MLIDHIGFEVSDFDRSKAFYTRCLRPLGFELIIEVEGWAGYGRNDKAELWFGPGESAHQPMHIAFVAEDRTMVDRFYQAALEAGGSDNGAPGIRDIYHANYYGAFVIDPDGHNIEAVCHRPGHSEACRIETGYIPGLIGRVAEMHAGYYAREWGFSGYFETRVASEMSEFINRYDAERDCSWSALIDNCIEASITIDGTDAGGRGAQLRWFIASDKIRGSGIGARLIGLAMDFCRQKNYQRVYLHSFKGLEAARHLYQSAGFKLVQSETGDQWGTRVEEQCFEARL